MMTKKEMQLAVCEKLPELIEIHDYDSSVSHPCQYWSQAAPAGFCGEINWPTEGLQVCHEAEKLLEKEKKLWIYHLTMQDVKCLGGNNHWKQFHATYEQRLEALCRVWFPERFTPAT